MARKKRHLDKRTVGAVLLIELGIVLLAAAVAFALIKTEKNRLMPKRTAAAYTAAPVETPASTPLPNFHAPKDDPDPAALGLFESEREEYAAELGREHWVDITPEGMEGYTLLRHISLGISVLVCPDGRSIRLGEQSEGCGAVSALYTDLDGDDENELLYTYTVTAENGTGCALAWLRLSDGTQQTAPFMLDKGTWALRLEDGRAILYRATLQTTDSLGYYELVPGEDIGEVIERDGAPALIVAP